jgi:HSP90 family molecular chaperone
VGKVEENDPLVLIGFNLDVDLSYLTFSGDKNEEKEKNMKQEFGQTCDWIKKRLGDKVASVQISNRLSSSPCVLVSGKFGWSANMER